MLVDPLIRNTSTIVATNFNPLTDDIDAIRGQETGYATLNPLAKGSSLTLSNGNLTATKAGSGYYTTISTLTTPTTGKWYYEVESNVNSNNLVIGIGREDFNQGSTLVRYLDHDPLGYIYRASDGAKSNNNSASSYGSSYTSGDVVGVGLDLDAGTLTFYKNGISQGVAFSSLSGRYYFGFSIAGGYEATANFGQKPFKFPPPDGFQPMNLSNVQPEKVIARPDQYVKATTYTGDGSTSGRHINIGFRPDLIWLKSRGSGNHGLYDSVRGPDKRLQSDGAVTEDTVVFPGASNFGFDFGSETYYNGSSTNYVAWTWKAGGDKNTFNIDDVGYANASDVNMNAGSLNSASYDSSQTWSSFGSSGTYSSTYDWTKMFAGDMANARTIPANNNSITADFSSLSGGGIAYTSSFKLYYNRNSSAPDVKVNGSGISATADGTDRVYELTGSGLITSVGTAQRTTLGNGDCSLKKIEIDGKILLDNGVTPVDNFPSIAATGSSVGTKQGFSIIKWQGDGSDANRTVPHGLLEAPSFVVVKPLTEARHWLIWHKGYNDNDAAMLFDSGTPAGSRFGPQAPTSNVFGVYGGQGNRGTTDFIGYCWHDVPGLQKFGTYEGIGGTANGVFVELGFRPAIVWVKNIDTGSQSNTHWCVFDNLRPGFNKSPAQNRLHLDQNVQEDPDRVDDGQGIDILSNGFRVRSNNWYETNLSGATYIYCAWAEAPSINLYGAQANAR